MPQAVSKSQRIKIDHFIVTLHTSPRWSTFKNSPSKNKKHRQDMERALKAALRQSTVHCHHSISHTTHMGGFATSCRRAVGFDMEHKDRKISKQALERLATPDEIILFDGLSPLFLWVMKEAAWKALRGLRQPKTISQIKIQAVEVIKKRVHFEYTLKVKKPSKSRGRGKSRTWKGLAFKHGPTLMAIALGDANYKLPYFPVDN